MGQRRVIPRRWATMATMAVCPGGHSLEHPDESPDVHPLLQQLGAVLYPGLAPHVLQGRAGDGAPQAAQLALPPALAGIARRFVAAPLADNLVERGSG